MKNFQRRLAGCWMRKGALLSLAALCACDLLEPAGDPLANTPRNQAYRAWEDACPDYSGEDGVRLGFERAAQGEVSAIECEILHLRAYLTPYTDRERQWWKDMTGEERNEETGLATSDLFQHLYVRWRLTGEGLEALESHARTMPKAEIDSALFLTQFEMDVLPRKKTDLCGRTAEDDPGFRFVMLGTGEREPASCGPAVVDGRGAG